MIRLWASTVITSTSSMSAVATAHLLRERTWTEVPSKLRPLPAVHYISYHTLYTIDRAQHQRRSGVPQVTSRRVTMWIAAASPFRAPAWEAITRHAPGVLSIAWLQ